MKAVYDWEAMLKDICKEKGKYDKHIGYCYYLRTEDGRWFGANSFWACELDVDNRWYNLLHGVRTIKV